MKFEKILMVGFGMGDLEQTYWNRIHSLCTEAVILSTDASNLQEHLSTADCLLVKLGATVDKERIDSMPKLKYIGMYGTGYGRIADSYAAKRGIAVCNIAGYATEGVAEFAVAVILEHMRDLERAKVQARSGNYSEATFFKVSEIKDKVLGVIGLGRIGSRVAEIARSGFGADVRYWSRTRKLEAENAGIRFQDVVDLLRESDFVSLHLAYNTETELFLNEERLRAIKPGAVVVNVAPMELVDTDALQRRLKAGDITFILDHSDELSETQAKHLATYQNCVMYPPVAYTTKEATAGKQRMFVENLENFLKGSPTNKVN